MNTIQLVGQAITGTNYATQRLFNFSPELVRQTAESFLASGVSELEIPEGVLNPEGRATDGCDRETLKATIASLPSETKVVGSYLGGDPTAETYVKTKKRQLDNLVEFFPDMTYAMLHPARATASIQAAVDAYAQIAEYADSLRPGFQLCFHNHYDSNGETAEQVRTYLDAISATKLPSLRWGIDTGHSHGMGADYLDVLETYAHLIGNAFHIKARVPAFDRVHSGDAYQPERDIWSNKAEVGGGLYGGFVNAADPEIVTPFAEVFRIIREKAKPTNGVVRGAMEIDNPRQHPRLEAMCGTLYFKIVHNIKPALSLSCDEIAQRVFAPKISGKKA